LAGDELLRNGGFEEGAANWRNQAVGAEGVLSERAEKGGRNASAGIHIKSENAKEGPCIWSQVVKPAPKKRMVQFSGWVRGKDISRYAGIGVQVYTGEKKMVGAATTATDCPLSGNFDWKRIKATLPVPEEAEELHLLAFLLGTGEVWFDDLSLISGREATSEEIAKAKARFLDSRGEAPPGLFRLRGEYRVKSLQEGSSKPTLLMPVPLDYREQVPLTNSLDATPPQKLHHARIYEDRPGNFVAEVILEAPTKDEAIEVRWSAIVLCGPRSFSNVPNAVTIPAEWPRETHEWLRSTACVQSSDERIRKVAKEIRGNSKDVMEIIALTLKRAGLIHSQAEDKCTDLDAVSALHQRGSCTSHANLVAALLRANGIPARVVSGYPTWCGAMQTHYIVEAYVPDYGWYPIESTSLKCPWPPQGQLQLAILPADYEEKSQLRNSAMAGVPYLSLTEYKHPDGAYAVWGIVDPETNCDYVAERVQALSENIAASDWAAAIGVARRRWHDWLSRESKGQDLKTIRTPLDADAFKTVKTLADLPQ